MLHYLTKSVVALIFLTLLAVSVPVRAQSSDVGLSIRVNPTTSTAGGTVGVFAVVTNNTSSKLRTTVTLASTSACGVQTNIGYSKLALNPGQAIQVTVSYVLAPDACAGQDAITISSSSGGKNSTGSSATAYLTVQ
jgi:hypothetical protein